MCLPPKNYENWFHPMRPKQADCNGIHRFKSTPELLNKTLLWGSGLRLDVVFAFKLLIAIENKSAICQVRNGRCQNKSSWKL